MTIAPRYRRAVLRLHRLGPRVTGEFLTVAGVPLARVEAFAALDRFPREILTDIGADTWASTLFMVSS